MANSYDIGTTVETKKQHPCGSNRWEIIRTGGDFKIKCVKCARIIMLDREKFEKSIKKKAII